MQNQGCVWEPWLGTVPSTSGTSGSFLFPSWDAHWISCKSEKIGATVVIAFVSHCQELRFITDPPSFSVISSQVVSGEAFEDAAEFLTPTK